MFLTTSQFSALLTTELHIFNRKTKPILFSNLDKKEAKKKKKQNKCIITDYTTNKEFFSVIKPVFFLSSDKYVGTLRNNQSLSIIKFLHCSLVIGTGKEGPPISRKHCTCFSGN